jgi:hypothetical protein
MHHHELPGSERDFDALDGPMIDRVFKGVEDLPQLTKFADAMRDRPEWQTHPLKQRADYYHNQGFLWSSQVSAWDPSDKAERQAAMTEAKKRITKPKTETQTKKHK